MTTKQDKPICTIIAGPNGAGKTTFALNYLPTYTCCRNFVNADMIATGLWLPSVEMSIKRVAERVAHGGHDIPVETITRRYSRSINNLLNDYAPLCDHMVCFENFERTPEIIFTQNKTKRSIINPMLFNQMLEITHE